LFGIYGSNDSVYLLAQITQDQFKRLLFSRNDLVQKFVRYLFNSVTHDDTSSSLSGIGNIDFFLMAQNDNAIGYKLWESKFQSATTTTYRDQTYSGKSHVPDKFNSIYSLIGEEHMYDNLR